SSKASEMYLRKIRPSTTCLYSAASMLERRASAARQSSLSKPRFAPLFVWLAIRSTPIVTDWDRLFFLHRGLHRRYAGCSCWQPEFVEEGRIAFAGVADQLCV